MIGHASLCRERVMELMERTDCCELNEHNFWVRKIPQQYAFHFVSSRNDTYGDVDTPKEISKTIFSRETIQFLDALVTFGQQQEWWFSISARYAEYLELPHLSKAKIFKEQYCLCTVINMGEVGEFSDRCIEAGLAYLRQKQYCQDGTITGIILGRGMENGRFVRYMEIRIPILVKKP